MYKLLQINTTYNWGSTGRIAEEIGQTVIKNNWESYIAFGRYINKGKSHPIKIGNNYDIYNHVIQTRFFDNHGRVSNNSTKQLIKKITEIKPDIIHLHNIHGYYLNYQILFDYLSSIETPIVWTLHDCWPFTGHCAYYTYVQCEKWKEECHHCPQIKSYPASFFCDNSQFNFNDKRKYFTKLKNLTLIPVSKWLKEEVQHSFLKDYPIHVINNGIDITTFQPLKSQKLKWGLTEKFTILGVASNWEERKGLKDFIKLSNILDNDKYQIVLVGLTNDQIKSLPNNIIGISRTNNIQELAEIYSSADLFINPTWEDNFPTTNLESLACGTPIITYKTGGSIEAIDNKTGFIVETGNILELREKVELFYNIEDKTEIKNACRIRALKLYNKEERYSEYYHLYLSLLNKI